MGVENKTCKKCHKLYDYLLTETNLCADCVGKYPYFLSFIEEGSIGGARGTFGRVEVYKEQEEYTIDELRFVFKENPEKEKEFRQFRDKWDFQNVSKEELKRVKTTLKNNYTEKFSK